MIAIRGVQKVKDQVTVLNIETLVVPEGASAAVIGLANSGLDDLFELLTGKSRPSLGKVTVGGIDPASARENFGYRVGVLFPQDGLYLQRTARQNLFFQYQLRGLKTNQADALLNQIGLADQANVRVDRLSTSLSRRLAFGCATLHQPEALILHSPFSRCDQETVRLLTRLIQEHVERGAAVLILADDRTHLDALCSRIYLLEKGQIAETVESQEDAELSLPFKIPVRLEGRVVLVNPGDILYVDAVEGRTNLHTGEGSLPTQFTLTELETRLLRRGFFRAHRSYLVNLQHIKEVIPYTRSSYTLLLDDEAASEIPLSRSAIGELKELLGF